MFTAFIGNLLLISRGFRISSFVFMIINCFSLFLLLKFDFEAFRDEYDFFSILYLALCYILLLIGVGASALLSQQILVDSHQKYKQYIFKNKKIELKNEEKKKEMKNKSNNEGSINQNDYEEEDIIDDLNNKESESHRIKIKKYDYDEGNKDFERKEEAIKKKREKQLENKRKKMEKKEKRRFDYFFIICLTTILGYFGKYSLNFMLIYREIKKYENQSNDNNYINNQTGIFENLNEKEISFFKNVFGLYFASYMSNMWIYYIF